MLDSELRKYGYVEGRNLVFERRYAAGKPELLPRLAAELVEAKVDVILVNSTSGTAAAQRATRTIPIVMAPVTDPVIAGLITSLSHPGGNITGMMINTADVTAKRLQTLTQVVPRARRIAALYPGEFAQQIVVKKWLQDTKVAAAALGLLLEEVDLGFQPDRWDDIFRGARDRGVDAAAVSDGPPYVINANVLANAALKNRMPTIFGFKEQAEAGGLIAYGPDTTEMIVRSVTFVDRILKGAKPGDLPIEQPTRFQLVINQRTAKALGLMIPKDLLLRADNVIE